MVTRTPLARLAELKELMLKAREGVDDSQRFAVRTFAGPARFAGVMQPLRIAHVTDQHVGRVTAMSVQERAIDLVREGAPDIVLLTGDFVNHSLDYLAELTALLSRLELPAFAVLGNHDYWSGANEVRRALAHANVEVLDNAWTQFHLRGETIQLVGLDDAYTGHADLRRAVKGLDTRIPTIGLSHIGEEADGLWANGVPLVFSGHTHAGQVTVAGLNELMLGHVAGHKYLHGLYGKRDAPPPAGSVYVGAGIGSGVVPVRIGERTRREVAFFELGKLASELDEPLQEQSPWPGRKPPAWLVRRRAAAVKKKERRRTKASRGAP